MSSVTKLSDVNPQSARPTITKGVEVGKKIPMLPKTPAGSVQPWQLDTVRPANGNKNHTEVINMGESKAGFGTTDAVWDDITPGAGMQSKGFGNMMSAFYKK